MLVAVLAEGVELALQAGQGSSGRLLGPPLDNWTTGRITLLGHAAHPMVQYLALRSVLEGSGVWTLVNGDAVHMAPGDLILTPSWTWHEHHNPGTEPMIWFDGLDLPLVRSLDAIFFEPGSEEPTGYEPTQAARSEQLCSGAGLLPAGEQADVVKPASGRSSR